MTDGRAWGRAAVAVLAALAVVTVSAAVPAVLGADTAPARSLVSVQPAEAATLSESGLGALSAADAAPVGGGAGETPLRSQDATVHFVVRADQPSYWRTGAYDRYTGQGWERAGRSTAFDGVFDRDTPRGDRITYEVTLKRPATALPTAWRPTRIDAGDGLRVQPETTLTAPEGVPAGTSYEGVSHSPARDPAVLRTAGRAYPAAITDRYLGLPDEPGTRRLARFTTNLTSDARTPYETAVEIERWLEANKAYSLNASHDPSEGTVASQFLFEMETGYCEYYATAMVAMLRSQGIPSRYVVGYSTGQQTGPDEYTVRALNAHAWVEVYVPEVGWVRFDPTPGGPRLATEQASFAEQTGNDPGAYTPTETGSPGETFSLNGTNAPDGADASTGSDAPGLNGTSGSPGSPSGSTGSPDSGIGSVDGTPNGTVDGTPPDGVVGSPSGTVDGTPPDGVVGSPSGTVDGTPPDGAVGSPSGTVDGTPPDGAGGSPNGTVDGTPTGGTTASGNRSTDGESSTGDETPTNGETPAGGGTPGGTSAGGETPADTETRTDGGSGESDGGASETDTATDATDGPDDTTRSLGEGLSVSLNRTAVPGARVTVTVTRDGEPVGGATVTFNGEPIGTTTESGTVVGRVPYAASVTVAVRTNASTGAASRRWPLPPPADAAVARQANETTYELETTATVTVVGEARPNGTVTIVAAVADVPLRNATVRLDGEVVGRTDRRGRLTVGLPAAAGNRTIGVDRGAVTGSRTIEIPGLQVDRSVEWPLAVPFAPVTVTASRNGEPANATIAVNDRRIGATGVDGERTVRLPVAPQATLAVTSAGERVTTTIGGLYARTAGLGGALVALVGGAVLVARRRGIAVRELPLLVERVLTTLVELLVVAASGLSALVARGIDAVRAALADRDPAVVVRRVRAVFAARLHTIVAWLHAAVTSGVQSSRGTDTADGSSSTRDARDRIRAAWRGFVASIGFGGATTVTPGEVARRAVAAGLPAEPVARLRDAYRAVEYGGEEPAGYVATVRRAIEAIRGDEE